MRVVTRPRLILAFTCVVAVGIMAGASPLTILYTNDLHLHLERAPSIEAAVRAERDLEVPVLLLDAGDTWHDFRRPIDAVWGADEMVSWMNRVGYDAMAVGNHELYLGLGRLTRLIEQADFPALSASLDRGDGRSIPWTASATVLAGELEVLVIGLTTGELLPYLSWPWLHHRAPIGALEDVRARIQRSPDVLVVLGHLPIDEAVRISKAVPEIDIFLTGHSHETTAAPVRVGETLILQSGAFGRNFGRLRIDVTSGGVVELVEHALVTTEETPGVFTQGLRQLLRVSLALAATLLLVLF